MSRLNVQNPVRTHEGAKAYRLNPKMELRRSVMACLLWEGTFYESGKEISERITELVKELATDPETVASIAIEARYEHHLRHCPLLICAAMAKYCHGSIVANTIAQVVNRADELTELVAIICKINGVKPSKAKKVLSAQAKKGLARAFTKFNEYQLAKYDRGGPIKLRDVLFMVHAKPEDRKQHFVWKRLVEGKLATPDTWEVSLATGQDKKGTFERLMREDKLGYLALLRNLRNMLEAGVDRALIEEKLLNHKGVRQVLPFRFIAAARHAPRLEPTLDAALLRNLEGMKNLPGVTAVLIDVSISMDAPLSSRPDGTRSELTRRDAAAALGAIVPSSALRLFTFSDEIVEVPPRKGMAGVDAIIKSQPFGMTDMGGAVRAINEQVPCDRLIVITDEQSQTAVPAPKAKRAYMINVANYKHGVGYGKWTHLDGFSESVLKFITAYEEEFDGYR